MIFEWFASLASAVGLWVADLFPDWQLPSQLADPDGMFAQIFALGHGLSPWVDWRFVAVVAAVPLAVWAVALTVRAARVLLSHLPAIGGRG